MFQLSSVDKNSKRHNKFLLPVLAKAIYASFCKTECEISNVVNYEVYGYADFDTRM